MTIDSKPPKCSRLVQFLEELVRLRSRTIMDLDSYEEVLWLGGMPEEDECYSRHRDAMHEDDPDLWVEVRKPREPRLPRPPAECEPWLGEWDRDDPETEPTLQETILAPVEAGTGDALDGEEDGDALFGAEQSEPLDFSSPKELALSDYPEIQDAWQHYVDTEWRPWAVERKRWASIQSNYAKLFEIHSHLQTRGEQAELLVCIGLLAWNAGSTRIRRHLVTGRVDLVFDETRGRFQIRPHSSGVRLSVELDMLPPESRLPGMEQAASDGLAAAGEDIWDRSAVDPVMSSLAHQLSDHGEFFADELDAGSADQHPAVRFAPALVLRRRSERSVQEFLRKIKAQVDSGLAPPAGWRDLCEASEGDGSDEGNENGRRASVPIEPAYLPLPTNEEQRRILGALDHPIGALVQGPPGTGKSHTIANLVCHLLATGKRVLITAQTPRALDVLRDKLPEEIRPLAVSLLGSGAAEQRSLEESVQGIAGRFDQRQAHEYRDDAKRHSGERQAAEEQLVDLAHRRRVLREQDTRENHIAGYFGTAEQIAKDLASEAAEFEWFSDSVRHDASLPVPTDDVLSALGILRRIPEKDRKRLSLARPDAASDLPEPAAFRELLDTERRARSALEQSPEARGAPTHLHTTENVARARAIIEKLRAVEAAIGNASNRPQPWTERALHEVLTKRDRPWFELHLATEDALGDLRSNARDEDRRHVDVPGDPDWSKLRHDAESLRRHFESGGKDRWWLFKPGAIKQLRYLTTDVRVDGHGCKDVQTLQKLISHADFQLSLEHAWKLWTDLASPTSQSMALQVQEIEELQEALDEVLGAYRRTEEAAAAIAELPEFVEPSWQDVESRASLLRELQAIVGHIELADVHRKLSAVCDDLGVLRSRDSADTEILDKLTAAVRDLDFVAYATAIEELRKLDDDAAELDEAEATLATLESILPTLASEIAETPDAPEWDARLRSLQRAFNHARARQWIEEYIDSADINLIERNIRDAEKAKQRAITNEAASLAWAHAFERMEESHRRALMSWQQAIKALGKGTGKYAFRHRREAQAQLQKCRPAIPAWIMPLHRVFDSIDPEPGIFDVVIVDEASQCGPDSLPLFYIGKKVLIVGDDKQISPSHVGVNREHVHQRMREFLGDFEHRGSFDLERSLFDHGELRIGNRIVLREHFRCMPEIIRFSNDLCYRNTPLIPLRQYPPQRLEPLIANHVENGFREGDGSRTVNRPEAERLVDAIAQCCSDPRYGVNGRRPTLGVISLQGWTQAEYIEHLLLQRLGAEEMAQRRLLCGDAYSFQGDERDLIFLSLVAAPNMRIGALTKFADQQRFNVAASRGRDQLWLFHSVMPGDLSENCMRRQLLEHFLDPTRTARHIAGLQVDELRHAAMRADRQIDRPPDPFESWFEVDVALKLAEAGLRVVPQFEMAGYRIDLVVEGDQARLAVECDGDRWHGADRYEADLDRQRKLERSGWTFARVRGSAFYTNPVAAMSHVWSHLSDLGISSPHGHAPCVADPQVDGENADRADNDDRPSSVDDAARIPVSEEPKAQSSFIRTAAAASELELEPYVEWAPTPMADPRTATVDDVLDGLMRIVEAEGPIIAARACLLYAKAAGIQRVGSELRRAFNRALSKAKRNDVLEFEQSGQDRTLRDAVIRVAGSPTVRPRTAGSRSMSDIPESELAFVMSKLIEQNPQMGDEERYRRVLDLYGFQRLRQSTRDRLAAIRPSIGGRQDKESKRP